MNDRLLTITEVANWLGVPVRTLYVWNSTGTGPAYLKVGKHVRFRREAVEAWLDGRERGGRAAR